MLLEVENMHITYSGKEMVHGVNLKLDEGEILTIVGESGSGKTTVIRAILGCLPKEGKVSAGKILFKGKDLVYNTKEEWRKLCGREISMVFQDSGAMMDPIQKIGTQFIEYIQEHETISKDEARTRAEKMLARMNLPNPAVVMDSFLHELSGGMRQRVGVAMAMFFRPKLLLADEPTSALDVTTQVQIVKEMMDICHKDGTAIILVTHNLGVASYMSDQLMVMKNGLVEESGQGDDVIFHAQSEYTKSLLRAVPTIGGKRYVS